MEWNLEDIENACNKAFKGCLNYLNNDLKNFKSKELSVAFNLGLNKETINASASVDENGKYHVVLENAAVKIVFDFYNRILVNEDFYKIVSGEDKYDREKASKYVDLLTEMTIKNILFHELGHIFNGHVDYIKDIFNKYKQNGEPRYDVTNYTLYEINSHARPYLQPKEWQAIEWNADDFSATKMVGLFTYDSNIDEVLIKNKFHGLLLIVLTLSVMYSLMGMGRKNDSIIDFKNMEHLPKRARVKKYIGVLLAACTKMNEEIKETDILPIEEYVKYSFAIENWANQYVKQYWKRENYSTDNNLEELDEEHENYYLEVELFYYTLLEKLEKYTYFEVYDEETKKVAEEIAIRSFLFKRYGTTEFEYIKFKKK
ncbi:MAG: hypothetical protein IKM20_00100 [Erysipelotrichales bacterium]|nr:hypothetical protein [Erysipelotrichales bacterium]